MRLEREERLADIAENYGVVERAERRVWSTCIARTRGQQRAGGTIVNIARQEDVIDVVISVRSDCAGDRMQDKKKIVVTQGCDGRIIHGDVAAKGIAVVRRAFDVLVRHMDHVARVKVFLEFHYGTGFTG